MQRIFLPLKDGAAAALLCKYDDCLQSHLGPGHEFLHLLHKKHEKASCISAPFNNVPRIIFSSTGDKSPCIHSLIRMKIESNQAFIGLFSLSWCSWRFLRPHKRCISSLALIFSGRKFWRRFKRSAGEIFSLLFSPKKKMVCGTEDSFSRHGQDMIVCTYLLHLPIACRKLFIWIVFALAGDMLRHDVEK